MGHAFYNADKSISCWSDIFSLGDRLQTQAAKVEELEAENAKLTAELQSTKQRDRENDSSSANNGRERELKTVEIGEYERVKALLAKSHEDYGRVFFARQVLESKLRESKNKVKQWQEYTEMRGLKYPKKQLKSLDPSRMSFATSIRDPRSSSAPTPPSISDMTPSVDDVPRTPPAEVIADDAQQQCGSPACKCSQGSKMLLDKISTTRTALLHRHRASSGDLTEASDVSEPQHGICSKTHGDRTFGDSNVNSKRKERDTSSSPIIVSERSLKRKNPIQMREDTGQLKPLVKSEQVSSSPLPASTIVAISGPHDSLDLDDIGGHIDTPWKRRKLEQIRIGSSKLASAASKNNDSISKGTTADYHDEAFVLKDEDGQNVTANDEQLLFRQQDYEKQSQWRRKSTHRNMQQAHNKTVHGSVEVEGQHPNTDRANPRRSVEFNSRIHNTPMPPGSPSSNIYPTPTKEEIQRHHTPQSRREPVLQEAKTASPARLQPMDPNVPILPRTNSKLDNRKASSHSNRRDHGAAFVPALAEDGEDPPSISNKTKGKHSHAKLSTDQLLKLSDAHHRLGTLLNEPSPAKSALKPDVDSIRLSKEPTLSKTPIARANRAGSSKAPTPATLRERPARTSMVETETPRSARTPIDQGSKSAQVTINKTTTRPSSRKTSARDPPPADDQPEHEPLRARPHHRLRLDDFKLNPAHGDFAYYESIRKHDEKQRTSGCIDRNCPRCKDIRKFVENSGYARTTPGQDPEQTDRRLIEEYLGGEKRRIERMSAEERAAVLLQAKTKQFADKFGKHRTAFGRAQSPVDFWNTDFPSTQEHERNREAARVREREKVEEMYWEAIRQGGKYVFADE